MVRHGGQGQATENVTFQQLLWWAVIISYEMFAWIEQILRTVCDKLLQYSVKMLQYSNYGSFGSLNYQMCAQNVLSSGVLFTESGRIFTFGANDWGQLGLGHTKR